jgi:hypothetical protein
MLAAVIQALIGGAFTIIGVYVGHVLKNRRAGLGSATTKVENGTESPVTFQPTITAEEKRYDISWSRQLAEVAVAVLLIICVTVGEIGFTIHVPLFSYAICLLGSYVVVSRFQEPQWLPVLMAVPIYVFIKLHHNENPFWMVAVITLGTVFAVIRHKSQSPAVKKASDVF